MSFKNKFNYIHKLIKPISLNHESNIIKLYLRFVKVNVFFLNNLNYIIVFKVRFNFNNYSKIICLVNLKY